MELLRILLTFTRPLSDKVLDIIYKLIMGPTKPLPPIGDKLLLLSVTELAEKIRKRKVIFCNYNMQSHCVMYIKNDINNATWTLKGKILIAIIKVESAAFLLL